MDETVHQDIAAVVFLRRVHDQVDLHVLRVADDDDRVEIDLRQQFESQHFIERDRPVRVGDADAGMVHPFDVDCGAHGNVPCYLT